MLYLYGARNFSTLVGLASPEPLSNMYDATYFRATWVLTALDAGFWTAMKIKTKWLRDIASIAFSAFYLIAAEQADEKVRKVRGMLTVDHLRASWNKGTTPYLSFAQGIMRPRFTRWPPRAIRIPRPSTSDYKEPVSGWLYFDGPLSDLENHNRIVLDIPGGGFVAMDPRANDDKLFAWAGKTGLPILSLDYRKAPEYPYPYALNECYDVYTTLVKSKGRCVGMSGNEVPGIVVTGDSAGGNLATAMVLMIMESGTTAVRQFQGQMELPVPDGLVLFYPALDANIGNWMSDEQMALINDRRTRGENKAIMRRKSMQYTDLVGTPHESDNDEETTPPKESPELLAGSTEGSATLVASPSAGPLLASPLKVRSPHPEYSHCPPQSWNEQQARPLSPELVRTENKRSSTSHHPEPLKTRLAMSSMISYFNDRILTPEMMRAMIILYVGPHNRPDFSQDYLLSPVLAPDALLARFPKTYFLTGERDPLVDDTVIFSGRLRRVKQAYYNQQVLLAQRRQDGDHYGDDDETNTEDQGSYFFENGRLFPDPTVNVDEPFNAKDAAEVVLIPGISHGFIQFPSLYPPAWKLIHRSGNWILDAFDAADARRDEAESRRVAARAAAAKRDRDKRRKLAAQKEKEAIAAMAAAEADAESGGRRRHHSRTNSSGDEDKPLEMSMTRARGRTLDGEDRRKKELQQQKDRETGAAAANGRAARANTGATVVKIGGTYRDDVDGRDAGEDAGPEEGDDATPVRAGTPAADRKAAAAARRRHGSGDRSLVKLKSSDDLLARRMQGLANGLTRRSDD